VVEASTVVEVVERHNGGSSCRAPSRSWSNRTAHKAGCGQSSCSDRKGGFDRQPDCRA
jgi:hypothetical protein